MTLPEIAVLLDDGKGEPSIQFPGEMTDAEYAQYWASMTPKQRLLKVAEGKR